MSESLYTLIIDIGTGSVKMLVGYELSAKPVILHTMQSEYFPLISQEKLVNPEKTFEVIKNMYHDMKVHFGHGFDQIQVVIPPIQLDVYHGEKRTNTVDQNGIIHAMDIQNVHSMFSKEIVGTGLTQVCIVPVSYQIDGDKTSTNPPLGEITQNIVLQAYVQYIKSEFLQEIISLFRQLNIPVKRYILDAQGIADMLESQYQEYPDTYVMIDHGAQLTHLNLISQHKLIRSNALDNGSEQLTQLIAFRFQIDVDEARRLKEVFGYERREQVFDGVIYQKDALMIKQSQLNEVIEEYYKLFVEEVNSRLKHYEVDKKMNDLRDLPLIIVGGGSNLIGLKTLLNEVGQHQGIDKPYIKTVGARRIQLLSSLGGLRFAHRYKVIEDDVRHHVKLERESSSPKRRFTNYEDE
jgi:cell division ATPase FtsA